MTACTPNTSGVLASRGFGFIAPRTAVATLLAQGGNLPPAFPRPGANALLENARVIVWDIGWLKQQYPLHRHTYALVGVCYSPGGRTIIAQDGSRRLVSTKAWDTAFQPAGVTHIEEGASDTPMRAVFIEMKDPSPSGDSAAVPVPMGTSFIDNDRVTGWLLQSGPSSGAAPSPARRCGPLVRRRAAWSRLRPARNRPRRRGARVGRSRVRVRVEVAAPKTRSL